MTTIKLSSAELAQEVVKVKLWFAFPYIFRIISFLNLFIITDIINHVVMSSLQLPSTRDNVEALEGHINT